MPDLTRRGFFARLGKAAAVAAAVPVVAELLPVAKPAPLVFHPQAFELLFKPDESVSQAFRMDVVYGRGTLSASRDRSYVIRTA